MIPRIWSACLLAQADHLNDLAAGISSQPSRADRRGRSGPADKAPGRAALAERIRRHGEILRAWAGTPDRYRGGDLDPAVVGLVCGYLYRHGAALAELKARAGPIDARSDDEIAVIKLILERF